MKKSTLILATLLALLFMGLTPAQAKTTVEYLKIRGPGVFAEWEYVQGNERTFVVLFVTDEFQKDKSGHFPSRITAVNIFTVLEDSGSVEFIATGTTEDFSFSVDKNHLSTARLVADLDFLDFAKGNLHTMHVDLTWTATGERVKEPGKVIINEPDFHFSAHFDYEYRDATVTGTIFAVGKEFVQGSPIQARLLYNKLAQVTVTRGQ